MKFKKHHRSLDTIKDKANKDLGLHRDIWYSEKEIQFVKGNYSTKGAAFCAIQLGRPIDSIRSLANKKLNLGMDGVFYTEEEIQFVKDNYPTKGAKYCAEHLGVSTACVSDLATKRFKLTREGIRYTEEELNFVREHYLTDGAKYCADRLGTTIDCIRSLANKRLGLKDKTINTKKKIYCRELDMAFDSANEAERYMLKLLCIKRYHLDEGLKSGKPVKGYHWEYVD